MTTPADIARAHKLIAEGHLLLARAAESNAATDYYDQNNSPLGKRRHLRLARDRVLPSSKVGRQVLIKRADLDAWLAEHQTYAKPESTEEAELAAIADRIATRSKKAPRKRAA